MAFFITNYTYDEPLQYLFLFTSLLALLKNNTALFFISFLLAVFTKETSVLFIGFLLLHYYKSRKEIFYSSLIALGLFIAFQLFFFTEGNLLGVQASRLELFDFNFETADRSLESIVSFLMVTLLGVLLSIKVEKVFKWRFSFFVILLINTAAVMCFAYSRESRLFALPLILFWPFAGRLLQHTVQSFYEGIKNWNLLLIIPMLISSVGYYYTYAYLRLNYKTSITLLEHTVNWQYLVVLMPIVFILIYIKLSVVLLKYLSR